MASEMVDRIAKQLFLQEGGSEEQWSRTNPVSYWARARGILCVMREPTEAQYEALSATGKMWREQTSTAVWQTYIDAELREIVG